MLDRWNLFGFPLQKSLGVAFSVFIVVLQVGGCLSINGEGLALLRFRMGVESDPFGALANWNYSDSDPCRWTGISCVNGEVWSVDLKNLSLGGILAPDIGKLRSLRSLVVYRNAFLGSIPKEIAELKFLEVLDLRGNKLNGTLPVEMGDMPSLKRLLICDNKFQGSIPTKLRKLNVFIEIRCDENLVADVETGIDCIKGKFRRWSSEKFLRGHTDDSIQQRNLKQLKKANSFTLPLKGKLLPCLSSLSMINFRSSFPHNHGVKCYDNMAGVTKLYIDQKVSNVLNHVRRTLLQKSGGNLAAAPISSAPPEEINNIPSVGSGSFPAVTSLPRGIRKKKPSPVPASSPSVEKPSPGPASSTSINPPSNPSSTIPTPPNQPATALSHEAPTNNQQTLDKGSGNWKYIYVLPAGAFVLAIFAAIIFVCRRRGGPTIGPWKTGLSGQLQKAFITGVPKLNQAELETACEDFSNIIGTLPDCMLYKGTLSSGVEIAVASTTIVSARDWSKCAEMHFRKKVDTLSRVNHKNFVNLLGYCKEEDPFLRMMVLEYAPNGSLFDHLHVNEFEHIDWNVRMRIIMGVAYCLQYMHHELNPPIPHSNLTSKIIYLTDDYAAKVGEFDFWKEFVVKGKIPDGEGTNPSELPLEDPESNVYSFGILLLEIISGRLPFSEEQGFLENWAADYLSDRHFISQMVDPSLQSFRGDELDVVCEVIVDCIKQDPRERPTMREVTTKLRDVLAVSPDSATPKLSPLWWAELEILSLEAS